jgi:hypothetical protein
MSCIVIINTSGCLPKYKSLQVPTHTLGITIIKGYIVRNVTHEVVDFRIDVK